MRGDWNLGAALMTITTPAMVRLLRHHTLDLDRDLKRGRWGFGDAVLRDDDRACRRAQGQIDVPQGRSEAKLGVQVVDQVAGGRLRSYCFARRDEIPDDDGPQDIGVFVGAGMGALGPEVLHERRWEGHGRKSAEGIDFRQVAKRPGFCRYPPI
jgi:hypothetical protein